MARSQQVPETDPPVTPPLPMPGRSLPGSMALVLGIALVKVLLTVSVSNRYGFHRDEFYYIASGRHLEWGYVDFPPLTPLLAALDHQLFGTSLVGLRVLPALAGGAIVVLGALIARELGGGRFGQALAAVLVAASPLYLATDFLFQTVFFEQLWVATLLYLVARLLRTDQLRLWPVIGFAIGLGMLTKYTTLDVALGLGVGILLTRSRRQLATPWPWIAVGIVIVMVLPNLLWQAQHGWPTLEYLSNHQADNRREFPPPVFLEQTLLFIGPFVVPLFVAGAYLLFRKPQLRLLGWIPLVVLLSLLLLGGKTYYLGPVYVLLYAAGAVWLEAVLARRRDLRWVMPVLIGAVVLDLAPLPIGLPVLPEPAMVQTHLWQIRQDYADMIGWNELVDSVAMAWNTLPLPDRQRAAIVTANYGEAGAIDLLGSPRLPHALSGHLTYYFWKPAHVNATTVLAVGFSRDFLQAHFDSVVDTGSISNHDGIRNYESGQRIYLCSEPLRPFDQMWPDFKAFR